jgi:hypothetical protein
LLAEIAVRESLAGLNQRERFGASRPFTDLGILDDSGVTMNNRGPIIKVVAALFGLLLITTISLAAAHHHDSRNAAASGTPGLANATVLIIRHAEKPATGAGLSSAGEAHALAYVRYFKHLTLDGAPVRIDTLIATTDSDDSRRERLTLEPLSRAMGLPIQQPFDNRAIPQLANWLAHGPPSRNILVAWHHDRVPKLLAALGLNPSTIFSSGRWPSNVYDWLIVLHFDSNGKLMPAHCRLVHEPSPLI